MDQQQPQTVKAERRTQAGQDHLAARCPSCGYAAAAVPAKDASEAGVVCRCGRHLKLVEAPAWG